MAYICPICGKLLRNERHLHAEDPGHIYGEVIVPGERIVDENTVEVPTKTALDYDDWRDNAGSGVDDEGTTGGGS